MVRKLLLVLLVLLAYKPAFTQSEAGKDFWLAYMDLDFYCQPKSSPTNPVAMWSDDTAELYITSSYAATVTIEIQPEGIIGSGIGMVPYSYSFTLVPHQAAYVRLPSEATCHTFFSDYVTINGVHVTSDSLIYVKMTNRYWGSRGSTAVIPSDKIPYAPEYYISTNHDDTKDWDCHFGIRAAKSPQFVVVGISPVSKLEIIPTGNSTIRNKRPNTPFVITLRQGETFQYSSGDPDLTGTLVRSKDLNSKFAVFASNRETGSDQLNTSNVLCQAGFDHTYEQMLPTVCWGKSYTALPFRNIYGGYYLKVLAAQELTKVYINGSYYTTLNQGEHLTYNVNADTATHIAADKWISVAQYTKGNACNQRPSPKGTMGDVSELMLVSDQQLGLATKVHRLDVIPYWKARGYKEDYVNVLARTADTAQFRINGRPVPVAQWQGSYASPGYVYAQIQLDSFNYDLASSKGFIAYSYGYMPEEGYSYTAGGNFNILNNDFVFSSQCIKDTMTFTPVPNDSFGNYSWDMGDGSALKIGAPVTHIFKDTGWLRVVMHCNHITTNVPDSVVKKIYVAFPTIHNFLGPDTIICGKVDFPLYARNFNQDNIYRWNDGHPNYYHAVKTPGQVWLKVTERTGCSIIDTLNIRSYPIPKAIYALTDTILCLSRNRPVIFTNLSTSKDTVRSNTWDFTDTQFIDNNYNTRHQFPGTGRFAVKLTVETVHGCKDDTVRYVRMIPGPQPSFTVMKMDSCFNSQDISFINTTVVDTSTFKRYRWYFSEGFLLTNSDPPSPWTYALPGTYTVRLAYETKNGCADTMEKTVTVYEHPVSAFSTQPGSQCLTRTTKFINGTASPYQPVRYSWDFGDGAKDTLVNPGHLYPDKINYKVKLIATSPQGCKDSISKTIRIYGSPYANFSIDDTVQCAASNLFNLKNLSTLDTGILVLREWRYSDGGKTLNKDQVAKSFATGGKQTIQLKVLSAFGCADSMKKTVTLLNGPLGQVGVNNPSQCLGVNSFNLVFQPDQGNDSITQRTWYYKTDSVKNANFINGIQYAAVGKYDLRFRITDKNGCTNEFKRKVSVNHDPVAKFSTSSLQQCFKGHRFDFTNQSSIAGGAIAGNNWSFGDADISADKDPPGKTYATAGMYDVRLIVSSDSGCMDTATITVTVNPNADITLNNVATVCLNDSSRFGATVALGSGAITAYLWDFGDGETSLQANPGHVFKTPGAHKVRLTTVTDKGCRDSAEQSNLAFVRDAPVPLFIYTSAEADPEHTELKFSNWTSPAPVKFWWDFGSYGMSVKNDTAFRVSDSGTIRARLYVTDANGCTGYLEKDVFVAGPARVFMPTIFTPNGDGHNDGFGPGGLLYAQDYTFTIYNRWGEVMFQSTTPGELWDGTYMGKTCPNGVFVYIVELRDYNRKTRHFNGTFSLVW